MTSCLISSGNAARKDGSTPSNSFVGAEAEAAAGAAVAAAGGASLALPTVEKGHTLQSNAPTVN